MGTKDKISSLIDRVEAVKREFNKEVKVAFADACKDLFNENPILTSFGWCQYTDYFNDGDELKFRVGKDYPDINGCNEDTLYGDHPLVPLQKKITEILRLIPNEIFKEMFGDHTRVLITKDGVSVEDYINHH